MKYVVVLIDGMADEYREDLGGKTPLEYAKTPIIDELAKTSELGMVQTVPKGMPPGSDVANLSVMGYDPQVYHTGRSPLEAASVGVELKNSDVTYRCNLVTTSEEDIFEDRTMVDHSAGDISSQEALVLIKDLKAAFDDDELVYYPGVSYRNLIVWHQGSVAVDLVPPHDFLERSLGDHLPTGDNSQKILAMMKKSYEILSNHPINVERKKQGKNPANSIWIWGEGKKPQLDDFQEKYGVQGAVISAVDLIKGIGLCSGLTSIDVKGATGTLETNFKGKAQAVIETLKAGHDYVYLHLEAPDECSHQGDLAGKIKAMEIIDRDVVSYIKEQLDLLEGPYKIMVVPDHPTPVRTRTHGDGPVPYMIFDSRGKDEKNHLYCERDCQKSDHYFDHGYKLSKYFLSEY